MFNQTNAAIVAILIIIPLSSIAMWNSTRIQEFAETSVENQKIVALASFYPLYEFTKEVGKDKVDVWLLVPPGIEPHDWEPSIQELKRIQQADIIIINGMGFEKWFEDIKKFNSNIPIIDSSIGINIIKEINIDNSHLDDSLTDPHIWLNPSMAKIQVKNIADALSKNDPENQNYYQKNMQSYNQELELLDYEIKNDLSQCNHNFIASHNAFSYFADEYSLIQNTVVSSNDPEAEPTSQTIVNLINLAKKNDIKIIFTEEGIDPRTSKIIANEIGGKVLTLSPLEIGDKNFTYVDRMKQNLFNLKEALCS